MLLGGENAQYDARGPFDYNRNSMKDEDKAVPTGLAVELLNPLMRLRHCEMKAR